MEKKSLIKMKKGNISVQVIFYIMMSIFMVAIILFGYGKINETMVILNEQERVEVQNQLVDVFEYCDDPLNKGNKKTFVFNSQKYNGVCRLGTEFISTAYAGEFDDELRLIQETGDNIVLVDASFLNTGQLRKYVIISAFKSDLLFDETTCNFDSKNEGSLTFDFVC